MNIINMGKETTLDGLEFDGDTVLCRVCGDKASGFHYGVHACEGCKGFFRRSIQQKIQYRPCLKNQQCNIMRVNRNRCQYCRLKKCIQVGMSRDAVRFGRVPKKEKARIIEQMQKVNTHAIGTALTNILQNDYEVIQSVINSHHLTCDFTVDHVQRMREISLQMNDYFECPAHMACPLNSQLSSSEHKTENNNQWEDFSASFAPAIKSVVNFAKGIPGFTLLNQDDQVTLLKAGTFEVLLVRLASLFDPDTNTMMFVGGKLYKRQTSGQVTNSAGFLLDSMFDFAERFNKLALTDDELALFSAIVLLSPDRPGLRNVDQTEKIQNKLTEGLQVMMNTNHRDDNTLFAKLLMKTTDLRTLNTLHSEKSIGNNSAESFTESRERLVSFSSRTTSSVASDDIDMLTDSDFRSEHSSPSESSNPGGGPSSQNLDALSLDSGCGGMVPPKMPLDSSGNQTILRTPYGIIYKEDTNGVYGFVNDPPRRRCNTMEREILTRPRLHTIEEGNRRRYTLDREYINKMVTKLSDRLEKRTAIHCDSVSSSGCNSATSSPIPENYQYFNLNKELIPNSSSESSAHSSCSSPLHSRESINSYPSSPNTSLSRSRSGSMGADDLASARPRCYSFHMNSEGRAAKAALAAHRTNDRDRISPENQQYNMMPAEMRRGSVGAAYGLHVRKKSLMVDRHPAYLSVPPENLLQPIPSKTSASVQKDLLKTNQFPPTEFQMMTTAAMNMSRNTAMDTMTTAPNLCPQRVHMNVEIKQEKSPPCTYLTPNYEGEKINLDDQLDAQGSKSDSDTEIFPHKKFDKVRKHSAHSMLDDKNESGKDNPSSNTETGEAVELVIDMDCKDSQSPEKQRSAGEAHPQLLAQLKSGPSPNVVPKMNQAFLPHMMHANAIPPSGMGMMAIVNGPMMRMPNTPIGNCQGTASPIVHPINSTSSDARRTQDSSLLMNNHIAKDSINASVKEQFHAAAVSHLKDKLLRKFDSMENLNKIGSSENSDKINTDPASTAIQQQQQQQRLISQTANKLEPVNPASLKVPQTAQFKSAGVNLYHPSSYSFPIGSIPAVGALPAGYNQHLSGMQQLAQLYSSTDPASHKVSTVTHESEASQRTEEGSPLNLAVKLEELNASNISQGTNEES